MIYQDTWINGKCEQKGKRSCSDRYQIVKNICHSFNKEFTVLDIGANMCYFGLRLIEDYNCNVIAFEFDHFDMRKSIIDKNKTDKLMFLNRKIQLSDIKLLNKTSHFDLILALSVIHHLPDKIDEWIVEFRKLADNVIIEFALDDSNRVNSRKNYIIPNDGILIGYGSSHLKKDFKRPMYLFK
jgi:2-polyprenyl-3-methyl-5-hydroxy-6-metoxy-1,4-benzoquinol methylase